MSRTERLLDLLQLLRNRRSPVAGEQLAQELRISIRTLYRDIATLQAQGADIRGEPGLGYVLRPGFTLPPLMFSVEEIEALVLGSRWVEQRREDPRLSAAAASLLSKVSAVLPDSIRDTVEATSLLVARSDVVPTIVDLGAIRAAIRGQNKLALAYDKGDGAGSERVVWPFAVAFFEHVRVVLAWCELRQDFRAFRLDRITRLDVLPERYAARRAALLKQWREREGIRHPDPAGN
ncbi:MULTISPECIES: YafY family protein [unclassified Devosia]|uniref:helix-turn-helix transcriptional regulator n=1 Tax=unclassified Devosia TaxID=196773 RepID=UPI0015548BA7|nr:MULTISPECIES: YafY family protein [unclassified Devosia]